MTTRRKDILLFTQTEFTTLSLSFGDHILLLMFLFYFLEESEKRPSKMHSADTVLVSSVRVMEFWEGLGGVLMAQKTTLPSREGAGCLAKALSPLWSGYVDKFKLWSPKQPPKNWGNYLSNSSPNPSTSDSSLSPEFSGNCPSQRKDWFLGTKTQTAIPGPSPAGRMKCK